MEEDRAIADLGPDVSTDLNGEEETVDKKPKRRFIGRRAADAKAAARAQENDGGIEDSGGAVQGAVYTFLHHRLRTGC
jgi:2-(3-amino-3-carboxypropyl)histidine synthase